MKGETCVNAVLEVSCGAVPLVSDGSTHAQFAAVNSSLLQMPRDHSSRQLMQLDIITLGLLEKQEGRGQSLNMHMLERLRGAASAIQKTFPLKIKTRQRHGIRRRCLRVNNSFASDA